MGIAKKALTFLTSPLSLISKKLGKIAQGLFLIGAGIITGNPGLIMMGIGRVASALQKSPKVSGATTDRLNANMDSATPRKIIFGRTAMATDVRYQAYTGTNQEYYEQILCVASHKVEAVEEIWFDTELAWSAAGGVTSKFAGYLTVAVKLEGTAANTVSIDANWGAAQRLTGCAYLHLKFKLSGNDKKTQSPFQTIPSRVTVRGKGAFVPDPRLSTAAGGSGSQSMSDQATWAYTTAADSGRNPACQILYYLLGWRINTKLAVGLGSPSPRIDYASFITAANICDESVAKAVGGTEPRYRSDGIFSEDDDPDTVLTSLLQAMNAELTDATGKIGIRVDYNDLASVAVALTDDDILDGDDWKPTAAREDQNIVRGRYTDPSDGALYQLVDYPQVTLAGADYGSPDGVQRIDSFDLPCVQSPSQAQRLAKLRLQRKQYPGIFTARCKMKGWGAGYGKIVTLTHASLGFSAKKFRVSGQTIRQNGSVDLVLREVDPAQFAWSAEEAAVVTVAPPTAYNPLNDPVLTFLAGIADGNVLVGTGPYSALTTYSLGSVSQDQGSSWEYINPMPGAGHAPPTLPTTSNAYWRIAASAGPANIAVLLYQRSGTGAAPALPSGSAATYTFATGAVTGGTLNGWTTTVTPADGNPLYVTVQIASSNGTTASLPAGGWAAAVLKDGAGVSTALITLFQRTTTNSAPGVPTVTLTYTFATASLVGTLGSWSLSDPGSGSGAYLFATQAAAFGTGATDTIATGEWSAPTLRALSLTAAQLTQLNNTVDDNILQIRDKLILAERVAEMGARYTTLLTRAGELSVSATAMTTARSDFLSLLAVLSPTWDDVTQDTTLSTNIGPADLSGWIDSITATLGASGLYTTVTDGSAVASANRAHNALNAAPSNTYTVGIVVKKDATPAATRAPALAMETYTSGFAFVNSTIVYFDTSTGAFNIVTNSTVGGGAGAAGVVAISDDEWLVYVSRTIAGTEAKILSRLYPAIGASLSASNVATTGTISTRDALVVLGNTNFLGRDAFRWRLRGYQSQMDAVDKAISQIDGVTSLQISGPAQIDVVGTYAGNVSASVPMTRPYTFRVGTGAVTPSAVNVTTIAGTITCTIALSGSTGVLSVTGPTTPSGSSRVRIDATYNGVLQSFEVNIDVVTGNPPSGGGAGGTSNSVSVDANINSTTFTTIGTVAHVAAAAAPVLNAPDLEITAVTAGGNGTWNIEFKGVRENGVTDVDIGSVANSNPDPTVSTGPVTDPGYAALSVTDSGRSVGVSYTYYLQARLSSGTRSNHVTGTFTVSS
jgi:hypothetical protein